MGRERRCVLQAGGFGFFTSLRSIQNDSVALPTGLTMGLWKGSLRLPATLAPEPRLGSRRRGNDRWGVLRSESQFRGGNLLTTLRLWFILQTTLRCYGGVGMRKQNSEGQGITPEQGWTSIHATLDRSHSSM